MDKYRELAELLSDETLAQQLISESIETTRDNLVKRGLEFTVDELKELSVAAHECVGGNGEIFEGDLDRVAGGVSAVKHYMLQFMSRKIALKMTNW